MQIFNQLKVFKDLKIRKKQTYTFLIVILLLLLDYFNKNSQANSYVTSAKNTVVSNHINNTSTLLTNKKHKTAYIFFNPYKYHLELGEEIKERKNITINSDSTLYGECLASHTNLRFFGKKSFHDDDISRSSVPLYLQYRVFRL